jgi:type IV pilus assembly protein PilF
MKRVVLLVAAVLAAACSSAPQGPTTASGSTSEESGSPRNRARVHTELASLYYGRGNMAVALESLRTAVSADASFAPAHAMFGMVYMELRENQLAQQSFEKALSLAPTDPDINHNYGWFLCQTARAGDSLRYFEQAVKNPLYPTPWRSYSAAGVCAQRAGNAKAAEDYFLRALRLEPDEPTALLQLGHLRLRQGQLDDARRMVTRYNKLLTPSAESLWLGLRVERRLGDRLMEQRYANDLRRRFPSSPEYQLLQRGDYDK